MQMNIKVFALETNYLFFELNYNYYLYCLEKNLILYTKFKTAKKRVKNLTNFIFLA